MKRFIVVLISSIYLMGHVLAEDVTFRASAQTSVVAGNPFHLKYEVNQRASNLRPPVFEGFKHLAGPSESYSSSTQIINNKVSQLTSYTYTYVLAAEKAGTYSIPPATIDVKGKKYTSNALTIKVLDKEDQTVSTDSKDEYGISNRDLFIRATVSKSESYLSDALVYTLKLYTRTNFSIAPAAGGELPRFDGFLSFDIPEDEYETNILESYNGLNYRVYILKESLLYPQKSGNLTIEPANLKFNIKIPSRRRGISVFDQLFETHQTVQKNMSSNALKVKVNSFPDGKPSDFTNVVGNYNMQSSVTTQKVKADEPVTLKIIISGTGNLKMLADPKINFPADFEVYDPKITNNLKTSKSGVSGSKTYEYLMIPRFAGEFTIPPYHFSYFDTSAKKYVRKSTPAYTITVEKGDNDQQSTVVTSFASKEDVKFLGQDIRYIKTENLQLVKKGNYLFGSRVYWLIVILSTLFYAVIFIIYRKRIRDNANVALMKNKKANKIARKNLKNAVNFMKKGNQESFYAEVLRALWGYTGDKLGIPVSELNRDNITSIFQKHSIEDELIGQFKSLLDTCEFARYAPTSVSGGMDEVYKQAIRVISQLDNKIRKVK